MCTPQLDRSEMFTELYRDNDISATVTEVIALIKAAVPKIIKPTNRRVCIIRRGLLEETPGQVHGYLRWVLCSVYFPGFLGGAGGKEPACQCRTLKR